ncbi:MAG: hypothetical protein EAZ47_11300 [Bacteroidetes bacterium]|nr:MAG: hypothetical protein EAY72_12530 [Bacteroidota bacterium]TAE59796.1 MAG: hypothetical protein EAY68_10650 [Bacteroidota bacterium]TAF90049.1 MAG: hypothetical protein EAZ47_11300 [Bacteroidota bacterium]
MITSFFGINGISGFNLQSSVAHLNGILSPIEHKFSSVTLGWTNLYNYFFIDVSQINTPSNLPLHSALVATDKSAILMDITLHFEQKFFADLLMELQAVYGDELLQSNSSISGLPTSSRCFWRLGDMSIFLTEQLNTNMLEVNFSKMHYDSIKPYFILHN